LHLYISSCSKESRTPYSITKELFGLEIGKDVSVVKFIDEWGSITGDGRSLIVFNVLPSQLIDIRNECKRKGYRTLPIIETLPDNYIKQFLKPSDTTGYYWLEIDKNDNRDYTFVILNERSGKLVVYNVIQ